MKKNIVFFVLFFTFFVFFSNVNAENIDCTSDLMTGWHSGTSTFPSSSMKTLCDMSYVSKTGENVKLKYYNYIDTKNKNIIVFVTESTAQTTKAYACFKVKIGNEDSIYSNVGYQFSYALPRFQVSTGNTLAPFEWKNTDVYIDNDVPSDEFTLKNFLYSIYPTLVDGLATMDELYQPVCPAYAGVSNNNLYIATNEDNENKVFGYPTSDEYIPHYVKPKENNDTPGSSNQPVTEPISDDDVEYLHGFQVSNWKIDSESDSVVTENDVATAYVHEGNLCYSIAALRTLKIVNKVVKIMKLAVPLFIIIMGIIAFGSAAISNDDKSVSKASKSLAIKLIVGLAIYFIPVIISSVVNLANNYDKDDSRFSNCQVCFFGDDNHSLEECDKRIKLLQMTNEELETYLRNEAQNSSYYAFIQAGITAGADKSIVMQVQKYSGILYQVFADNGLPIKTPIEVVFK